MPDRECGIIDPSAGSKGILLQNLVHDFRSKPPQPLDGRGRVHNDHIIQFFIAEHLAVDFFGDLYGLFEIFRVSFLCSFEIVDELGSAPDYLFIPLGNAGNITAYWKGFVEYHKAGKSPNIPKMMAFEAEGAAAIVFDRVIEKPETVATAIRIGNPASWKSAVAARDESGGVIDYVTDPQILSAYSRLAAEEGVFGEPASAASVAGLIKSVENGLDLKGKRIVCIITGNGLKDPDNALKQAAPLTEAPADLAAVERIMTA